MANAARLALLRPHLPRAWRSLRPIHCQNLALSAGPTLTPSGAWPPLCLLGLAVFLLFGLTEAEDMTPAENWLLSTLCCLLPIAGTGVAMAVAGLVIWWAKLRNR